MSVLVPEAHRLVDIYGDAASEGVEGGPRLRLCKVLSKFKETFHHAPDFITRSPGRVNVIGEHIDYSLFEVLPMAVTADCVIAVRKLASDGDSATISIANLDSDRFPTQAISLGTGEDAEIDASKHEWTNYFKAGLNGALQYLRKHQGLKNMRSMQVMAHGNVPPGGGMSSSAALVCASALATMIANGHHVSKKDLFELAVVSERAVGVYSGGMDQAASIFCQQNYLLACSFYPSFDAEHVFVPMSDPKVTFLVAQSFVTADKHVTAPKHYNLRVVECSLAAAVLAMLHDIVLEPDSSPLGFSLRNVQEQIMLKRGWSRCPPEYQLTEMLEIVQQMFVKEAGYTREDLASILKITVKDVEKKFMSKFSVQADHFQLLKRALHVFSEAKRVLDYTKALTSRVVTGLTEETLLALGDLMNETQKSCLEEYDCSAPEIDQICDIAQRAGTYGSRLTGAGWGGCTVHLVAQDKVEKVKAALMEEYYSKRQPALTEAELKEAMVISKPSSGSAIIVGDLLKELVNESDKNVKVLSLNPKPKPSSGETFTAGDGLEEPMVESEKNVHVLSLNPKPKTQ